MFERVLKEVRRIPKGKVATYGASFLKPVDLINPRIAKFGLKVSF